MSKEHWDNRKIQQFQEDFLTWYDHEKRQLPWRYDHDPYRIWISEIMLQQTRVETVIDYFYRFMEKFPTIKTLADAPEDELLKVWEGLGYYSRARNLQKAAQQIMAEYNGKMPETLEEIRSLKGIGPYTAGAIGSIAFELPEPAIDGNVMRVVSRLFCISEDIAKPATRKIFDEVMRKIISQEYPGDFNQALMDLGSSICTPKNPNCKSCPIQRYCEAYQTGTQLEYPVKSKKAKPKPMYYIAGIIENEMGEYMLTKRPSTGLLANMWHFPLQEIDEAEYQRLKKAYQGAGQLDLIAEDTPLDIFSELPIVWQTRHFGEVTHVFSHLKWHILPFYGRVKKEISLSENQAWVKLEKFPELVFPKPQIKMVQQWQNNLSGNKD